MMKAFLTILFSVILVVLSLFFFRGTVLEFSLRKKRIWSLLWYWQLLIVLMPLSIVSYFGASYFKDNIKVFFVADSGVEGPVAFITLSAMYGLIIFLFLFFKLFNLSASLCEFPDEALEKRGLFFKVERFAIAVLFLSLIIFIVGYMLGFKHALLVSLFTDKTLLHIRLENAYASGLPSQLSSLIPLSGNILAISAGFLSLYSKSKAVLYLTLGFLLASAAGDKASMIYVFLFFLLARFSFVSLPFRFEAYYIRKRMFVIGSVLVVLLYYILKLQVPNLTPTSFMWYLLRRLGVGQMAGVYETYALAIFNQIPALPYFWHGIPFASLMVEYTDFQKILMMVTECYGYTEMGVKNSLFIAEAFAMGGIPLLVFSPIIVAASMSLGLLLFFVFLKLFFGKEVAKIYFLPIFLLTQNITGGFSNYPLLKGLFFVMLQFGLIWIAWLFVGLFYMKKDHFNFSE